MFELYTDPSFFLNIISVSSFVFIFLLWFLALYMLRDLVKYKFNKDTPAYYPLLGSLVICGANYLGFSINLYGIIPIFLGLAYYSLKWIPIKSLKWINFSSLLLVLTISCFYTFFNYKIHFLTRSYLHSNDILHYRFIFHPFFEIYKPGDLLGKVTFTINNELVTFQNDPLQTRIYMFYYTLIAIGLSIWTYIYFDVKKRHNLKIKNKPIPSLEKDGHNQKNIEISSTTTIEKQEKESNMKMVNLLEEKYSDLNLKSIELREQILAIKELEFEMKVAKHNLEHHPIFNSIKTAEDLKIFMETHVYCVWDFMSLLKKLQNDLCCTQVPWTPRKNGNLARLINDIVTAEETDVMPDGNYASHFEIYLMAMEEVGANTQSIKSFIQRVEENREYIDAIPEPARAFVQSTLDIALNKTTHETLGSFCNGRETVIPSMFRKLLADWKLTEQDAPMFHYYLIRHIELDGDEHGPAAERMMADLTKDNPQHYIELLKASIQSIQDRIQLWNQLQLKIERK